MFCLVKYNIRSFWPVKEFKGKKQCCVKFKVTFPTLFATRFLRVSVQVITYVRRVNSWRLLTADKARAERVKLTSITEPATSRFSFTTPAGYTVHTKRFIHTRLAIGYLQNLLAESADRSIWRLAPGSYLLSQLCA